MDFIKYKVLWFPILLLLTLLWADKVVLIDSVRKLVVSWKKIEPVFYETRETVFQRMRSEYAKRNARGEKLGLILGSSRTGAFDAKYMARRMPGYYVYNFSAPFAGPSFYYYMLEKVLQENRRVHFVILETGPLLFAPGGIEYSLAYAYSPGFVLRHMEFLNAGGPPWAPGRPAFRLAEAETYFLKRIFALYRYPLDPGVILENNSRIRIARREGGHITVRKSYLKERLEQEIRDAARSNQGGIPNPAQKRMSDEKLREHARIVESSYFRSIQGSDSRSLSRTQVVFTRGILEVLARNDIPVLLYRPLSTKYYREMLNKRGLVEPFNKRIRDEINAAGLRHPNFRGVLVDPHNAADIRCREFEDSYHLSGGCFEELTRHLLKRLPVKK